MVRSIQRDDLRRMMQVSPGRTILIDVRDKEEYEAEHIKGAISIPIGELSMRADKNFGKDDELIVCCGSFECPASTKAATLLSDMGFDNVLDYKGGLKDWKIAGFLTEGSGRPKAA